MHKSEATNHDEVVEPGFPAKEGVFKEPERLREDVGAKLVLRDYQQAAIDQVRACIKAGHDKVVLYLPTGGGKTLTAGGVIRFARAKGRRVLFVANRVELIRQTAKSFEAVGIPCGVIQGENTRAEWMPVIVASIQTLAARVKTKGYPEADIIVIDEAHGVPGAKAYLALLAHYAGVPVIGLTATPFTKGMGKHFREIVVAATVQELIAGGSLVDIEIYAPGEPDLTGVRTVAGDYDEKQLGAAVDTESLVGDIVKHWRELGEGKQTVVFATNIAHSEHITTQFLKAGISARHLSCYTKEDEKRAIIDAFKAGEFKILSNCSLLSEGFDAPATEVMILARPTKSLTRYIQMCGRILRPAAGKVQARLLDHSGTAKRLGFPTDELPLVLDDGKARTGSKEEKKPEEALPKVCSSCSFLKPAKVRICPACGFEPKRQSEVEVAPGVLAKLDRGAKGREKALAERFGDKQTVYSMLCEVRASRGYSKGWVSHKYRELFSVWPQGMKEEPAAVTAEFQRWLQSQAIRHAKSLAKDRHA